MSEVVRGDIVAIVEAGYQTEIGEHEWLEQMSRVVSRVIDRDGRGVAAYRMREDDAAVLNIVDTIDHTTPPIAECIFDFLLEVLPGWPSSRRDIYRRAGLGSISDWVPDEAFKQLRRTTKTADLPFFSVHDGQGGTLTVGWAYESPKAFTRGDEALFQRVAAHVGAGLRLLDRGAEPLDEAGAIVGPRGKVRHASGAWQSPEARARLRAAVTDVDRARTRAGRADPRAALELWQGLFAGRWSLLERFDHDGQRFVVARDNGPAPRGPAVLTQRQRQVLFYASLGQSNKEIGYVLGLSGATVASHLRVALQRLGIQSRAELVALEARLWAQARETSK